MSDTSVFNEGTSGVPYNYFGAGNIAPGTTDYSGSLIDPSTGATLDPTGTGGYYDPTQTDPSNYLGDYAQGGTSAGGQTPIQAASDDPGNQLPNVRPQVQRAGVGTQPTQQPQGLSALVRALMGGGWMNPWTGATDPYASIDPTGRNRPISTPGLSGLYAGYVPSAAGGTIGTDAAGVTPYNPTTGAAQAPLQPLTGTPEQMAAAKAQLGNQLAQRTAAGYPASAMADVPPGYTGSVGTAVAGGYGSLAAETPPADTGPGRPRSILSPAQAADTGETPAEEGPQTSREPETAPPTPVQRQAYPQRPMSPLEALINGIFGRLGLSQIAQQGPYAGLPINQIPWATPQQIQQYQRTGQFPRVDPRTGLAPGFRREPNGQITYKGRPPDGHTGGGAFNNRPYWNPETIRAADATDKWATQGGQGPPPSQQQVGARFQVPAGASPRQRLEIGVANTLAAGGMSNNAIAGVLRNITDESNWNPASRERGDQPRYAGEANYSHGLLQEGGPEWPLYQRFLAGRDWRDPTLQMQFMMAHMKERSPQAWQRMNNARTAGEAAAIFVNEYLRPAAYYRQQRTAQYLHGVPGVQQQLAAQ